MGELIPLFPLGTPLFPGVPLPLHIFEPRYRRLMSDLLALPPASDRRFFGVVAIRSGWEVEQVSPARALYDVGCTALLQTVRPQPDGGFRVVTVGGRRFRLLDIVVGDEPPYLQGEVDWLPEDPPDDTEADGEEAGGQPRRDEVTAAVARGSLTILTAVVRDLFTRYVTEVARRGAGGDEQEAARLVTDVIDEPAALSWLVASVALLTPEDRQALLAEAVTRRRLAAEARLLRRELTLLQTLGAVPVPLQELAVPMAVN
jgi:uncharacterized protein